MSKKLFAKALGDTVPVLAGYMVLGIGFGLLMDSIGYGAGWACLMSCFIYAGSMQYMAVSLISAGASLPLFALTTLMVNARHLFYGISMIEKYKGMGIKKPYLIFALTDETYSLVCSASDSVEEKDLPSYYLLVTLIDHIYWVSGTLIGSLLGALITFDTTGVDFALTALFITVLTDQMMKKENRPSGLAGVAVSVLCLLIFGADSFLIPAMLGITGVLLLMRGIKGKEAAVNG